MVLSFFRRDPADEGGLRQVALEVDSMLAAARHSFDLAMSAVVSGADPASVAEEVRSPDRKINETEQDVRRRLLVHAAVQGTGDIELVLGYLLLSRKIERVGDQAKNILDLAEEGAAFADSDDIGALRAYRDRVSSLFADVAAVCADPMAGDGEATRAAGMHLVQEFEEELRRLIRSDAPASYAVPRALLYRYLKRIAANLAGILSSIFDPFDQVDYPGGGDTDD